LRQKSARDGMQKINLKEHRPVADDEVHVLLVEPKSTVNAGAAGGRPDA
jgi:hypothetical protein